MKMKTPFAFCMLVAAVFGVSCGSGPQRIDREALVARHKVVVKKADPLAALTVGNGRFAFTADVTGLQSFPSDYAKGISLGTQSEWGWHSFIDSIGYKREEAIRQYQLNGRSIGYTVQWNSPERAKQAANWYRQNPHRLQLGNLGFAFYHKNGDTARLEDIKDIHQELDLWTGGISSRFSFDGESVHVRTFCHGEQDAIGISVESPLIAQGRLRIKLVFPYPTGEWTDEGANWSSPDKHHSNIILQRSDAAVISHKLDSTEYYVAFNWPGEATIERKSPHHFEWTPAKTNMEFNCTVKFTSKGEFNALPGFNSVAASSENAWKKYWSSGGAVDFAGSTDPRASELERRIILSQYQLRAQEAGDAPPQETGLTYNSWFGKPHLEMHWWHAAQYALWGRTELLERSMDWYRVVSPKARQIATRQGFEGIRWQKMTDNEGDETPSSVGAFLIWQQPHFIYFAELCYRDKNDPSVLEKYKDLVFATADFMASFPYYDSARGNYILGKGLIPAQERFKPEDTFNPTYELVYWHWGLSMAQQWRERLKMGRNPKWDEILAKLSPLPVSEGRYLFAESATDSYTNPVYRTDHPGVFGALGKLPETGQVDKQIMRNTYNWIWKNWTWRDTWGWDFPLTAMTATRLGDPEMAIDALMMDIQTNTYLVNGHNYQDDRLRIYMPGNGGLLAAVALMCAGYDGSEENPGIPRNGKWMVKWEGLRRMP